MQLGESSRRFFLFALLIATLGAAGAQAQTDVYVAYDCPMPPGTGSDTDPFCTIQDGICDIKDTGGGTVHVRSGTYTESIRMFPGVSVISTDGPAVTTIDATGQPCITRDCEDNPNTTTCTAVLISSIDGVGPGPSDRLEGFRITGGDGIFRDFGSDDFVVGGGIFVFQSSPTITNNEIVDCAISTSETSIARYLGGGIYVHANEVSSSPAEPIITQNLIELNIADPPAGQNQNNPSYAMGGGIYVGYWANPSISGNTISGNSVGYAGTDHQVAGGGGIALYTRSGAGYPVISQNLIQNNYSADLAGGLYAGWFNDGYTGTEEPSQGTVENTLFEYNAASQGGGAAKKFSRVQFRSNTFADNSANYGGGFYAGPPQDGVTQVELLNSLIVFNDGGAANSGGGLYVYGSDPVVRYVDLYGNTPEDVGGDKTDTDYVGVDGNIQQDPLFVNRSDINRDLRLQSTSPAIDVGDDAEAGSEDLDGAPRVQDGNDDGTARTDLGGYEYSPDWDGDGTPDWQDLDDDNDGVPDADDCDPRNRGVSSAPDPVGPSLRLGDVGGTPTARSYRSAQGHTYNFYRGVQTGGQPWTYNETCFESESPDTEAADTEVPASGDFFYYLVAAKNICAETAAHQDSLGNDIFPAPACAAMNLDSDSDGLLDVEDDCPLDANPGQEDGDADWVGDVCDNCSVDANPEQADPDDDTLGSACDNCPLEANLDQTDDDGDAVGNVCDNCVSQANPGQEDNEGDGLGDACDPDDDNDGLDDIDDNCQFVANAGQEDADLDGLGDACDSCPTDFDNDIDADGVCGDVDNCPTDANPGQENFDGDPEGDACDLDDDNDGTPDSSDCAPRNAGVTAPPPEVTVLLLDQGAGTDLSWTAQELGNRYDVAGGGVSELQADGGTDNAACLADDVAGNSWSDTRPDPAAGEGYYYMVRGQNECGTGTYGFDSSSNERLPLSACP